MHLDINCNQIDHVSIVHRVHSHWGLMWTSHKNFIFLKDGRIYRLKDKDVKKLPKEVSMNYEYFDSDGDRL
jgi:hypothetical protein